MGAKGAASGPYLEMHRVARAPVPSPGIPDIPEGCEQLVAMRVDRGPCEVEREAEFMQATSGRGSWQRAQAGLPARVEARLFSSSPAGRSHSEGPIVGPPHGKQQFSGVAKLGDERGEGGHQKASEGSARRSRP